MTLTIVVPTIGRPTLAMTLDSIARQALMPGDRVIVALDTFQEPPRPDVAALVASYGFELLPVDGGVHFMGNPQLNAAIADCTTDYFCALGDDDIYVDGAIARLRAKCRDGRAVLFQFLAPPYLVAGDPRRFVLWADRQLRVANISGCCVAVPREALVPVSDQQRCEVDFDWIVAMVAKTGQRPIWMDDVLIIARPEIRNGQPVHQGVGRCRGCGWRGFLEDLSDRLCAECQPVMAVAS
jgi:glycosyltransferase involved in cell wall biosynthesis